VAVKFVGAVGAAVSDGGGVVPVGADGEDPPPQLAKSNAVHSKIART
jgi:hypothetical protein